MIKNLDHFIGKAFNNLHFWGGNFLDNVMKYISYIAEMGIVFLLIGLILCLFTKTRRLGGTIMLSIAIGFLFTNLILKPLIDRTRPFSNISSDFYKWWLDAGAVSESGASFPSGHTTAATAFALAIFLSTDKKRSWPILLLPLAMASSRIYLMVHYFTDCIGGIVAGSIAGVLAWFILKWIYQSELRFFVFLKELELFKPKKRKQKSKKPKQQPVVKESNESFEYIPQAEEKLIAEKQAQESSETTQDSSTDWE